MKKSIFFLLLAGLFAGACSNKGGGVKLKADTDSVAYVIGMNIGMNLLAMDSTINVAAVCKGIQDVFSQSEQLSREDAQAFFLRYMNVTLPEKARGYEEQFLEDIAKSNRSYARTASGLTYAVDGLGNQDLIPTSDRDTVVIRYLIRTTDGKEVYSSYERKDSTRMAVGQLLPGVQESVKLIGKGGKIGAWMASPLAYGPAGDKELGIGPNATVFYEIELIDVDKYANRFR